MPQRLNMHTTRMATTPPPTITALKRPRRTRRTSRRASKSLLLGAPGLEPATQNQRTCVSAGFVCVVAVRGTAAVYSQRVRSTRSGKRCESGKVRQWEVA